MTLITSPHNPRLQSLRRLRRRRERDHAGVFAVEGEDLVEAARAAGREPVEGYRLAGAKVGGPGFVDVEAKALQAACSLASGSRVIAVYEQKWAPAPIGPVCLYLHGVRDPGNVGAALRSAAAFGASSVAVGPGCVDPHSPKAVRASMGAVFTVPLARVEAIEAEGEWSSSHIAAAPPIAMEQLPGRTVALVPGAGVPLAELNLLGSPVTLLVGAEREGLPAAVSEACTDVAHIPIASDSLNVAMAATVALYEITRCSRVPRS